MVTKYSNNSIFIATFICIVCIYSGLVKVKDRNKFTSLLNVSQICLLEGSLISSPVKTSNGKNYSAVLAVRAAQDEKDYKSSAWGNITLLIPKEAVEAFYPGKMYTPSKNKGSFLWEAGGRYKVRGRLHGDFFIVSSCGSGFFGNSFSEKLDYIRALARLQFKRLMYAWGNAGGLLLALLSGAKEYTENEIADAFKKSGLSHILALSGMHLSMFSGIAIFAGKKIGRKKLTFIIRIIALVIFVWFAGFSPSLLRAFICSMLLLIATISNVKQPDMLIILCFSFLLQLMLTPQSYNNTGFILSYGALAGILCFNKIIRKFLIRFLPGYFSASLSASASAQAFTAPYSLKVFGTFAPVGIIATTIVSPFISIFIYSGLALIFLCMIFPFLVKPSGIFVNFLYTVIKLLVSFFSKFPIISI